MQSTPISPSLAYLDADVSPSQLALPSRLTRAIDALDAPNEADESQKRARRARESRLARPSEPTTDAQRAARATVAAERTRLRERGVLVVPPEPMPVAPAYAHRGSASVGGRNDITSEANHLINLRSKHLEILSPEAPWVGCDDAPSTYSRLFAGAIRANAVACSIVERQKTEGAACQTSRLNSKTITQAATAQAVGVAVACAQARAVARAAGARLGDPLATTAVGTATLWKPSASAAADVFPVAMSARLPLNAMPTKLSDASVAQAMRRLAHAELSNYAVSEAVGQPSLALHAVCRAIIDVKSDVDAVWASFVLLTHLLATFAGRALLRATGLTDVDIQVASAFVLYGRAEVTRRCRLDAAHARTGVAASPSSQQTPGSKTGVDDAAPTDASVDADTPDTPVLSLEELVAIEQASGQRALATKRKRSRSAAAGGGADATHLAWWLEALRCDNRAVLTSLVAASTSTAREAAHATLQRQAKNEPQIGEHALFQSIVGRSAEGSARSMVSAFVTRRLDETPAVVTWRLGAHEFVGLTRTKDESRTTQLHACALAPAAQQPPASTRMRLAWSHASTRLVPSDDAVLLPGALERLAAAERLSKTSKKLEMRADRMREAALLQTDLPKTAAMSGVARSTISMRCTLRVHRTQLEAGRRLGERMRRAYEAARDGGDASASGDAATPQLIATEHGPHDPRIDAALNANDAARAEPLCTPASHLAVGLAVGEELRTWLLGKTRKNDPARVHFSCLPSAAEKRRDYAFCVMNGEPLPLLPIVDVAIDLDDDVEPTAPTMLLDANVALHVATDRAVRVPEVVRTLMEPANVSRAAAVRMARAVLWAATCQASFIADVGTNICSGHCNSAIACSKKISVPDVSRAMLLSAFDVYAGDNLNFEKNMAGSAHAGYYGSGFCTGISPTGIAAQNYRSDKRQHGNVSLSPEVSDELLRRLAERHFVHFADGRACERPAQTQGIPHAFVPGVHAHLDALVDALQTFRDRTERENAQKLTSLLVMPMSPWTQALSPSVDANLDISLATCVRDPTLASVATGHAHLPDATSFEDALLREPLFRRPSQAQASDNPYGTSTEHMESFFSAACQLVLVARIAATLAPPRANGGAVDGIGRVQRLVQRVCVRGARVGLADMQVVVDACLLLHVMYPITWGISAGMIGSWLARLVPMVNARVDADNSTDDARVSLRHLGLDAAEVAAASIWAKAFVRSLDDSGSKCAWASAVAPLLRLLQQHDGAHAMTADARGAVRNALERAVQGAWLVHSPDGVAPPPPPCPASVAALPAAVRRPLIDPVMVALEADGIEAPRGCLVGFKPFQLRQLCHLAVATGDASATSARCQVARNEGGLSLRLSSAPDVGQNRTSKSISPVQVESDEAAFGTREAKLQSTRLQRAAWDANVALLTPLFVEIREPLPAAVRDRGGPPAFATANARNLHVLTDDESAARAYMAAAALAS